MIYMLGLQEETSFQINTFLKVQRNQTLLVQYNRSISQCLMQRPYSDRIILINLSVVNTIAQFLAKIRLEINHTAVAIFQIRPILKLRGRDDKDSKKRPGKDLDRIDRNILNELQKDGRISNVELSKRVGLSPTPCLERVRRLERQGFIQGYTALLNPHYLDASLLVFVEITLNRGAPDVFEQFNTAVQKLEEIQECHLVSGDFDYLLKTRVPDMSAYRKLLGETLLRLPGVNDTRTYVVMEEVKQSNRLVIKTR